MNHYTYMVELGTGGQDLTVTVPSMSKRDADSILSVALSDVSDQPYTAVLVHIELAEAMHIKASHI